MTSNGMLGDEKACVERTENNVTHLQRFDQSPSEKIEHR
jgi:hypothetical protein